ncbi:hypothetical protein BC936DRAFT_142426 [Jimgerdemannia flammicorona]|uniref:Endonuclease n=1 Tax=Jimgerdemannia flammicorona TaxID=994334 RepID=A0A433DF74_9FUNG|nr:hypothetical protein BC936DRAFT_142426 [Jimgerdemannia flammicorona]
MADRFGFLVGGAVLGAISAAAFFEKLQFQRAPPPPPVQIVAPIPNIQPVQQPAEFGKPLNKFEVARHILPFGSPGPVSDIIFRSAYIASYNRRDRNPNWVAEHITAASLGSGDGVSRGKSQFKEDESIPPQFRARLQDYFKSNFDRGHMVPAADAKNNQDAMDETFVMTNIAPQVGDGFNRDYWAHLESFCRHLTKTFSDVYVITGPLYLPRQDPTDGKWYVRYQMIGNPPNVAVPTHFYKVIVAVRNGEHSVGAFVLPNAPIGDETPLEQFKVPLDAIERAAGMIFLEKLPAPGGDRGKVKDLCKETKCQIVLSRFAEAKKREEQKRLSA